MADTKKEIQFTCSPTGIYGLAYSTGDVVKIEKGLADEILANGHAIVPGAKKPEEKVIKPADYNKCYKVLLAACELAGIVVPDKTKVAEIDKLIDTAKKEVKDIQVEEENATPESEKPEEETK
ncbi:MAG: hypothetical protein BM557_09565 [Flavobacterium sp. MedPE-SWcel]|uniref:hypothetical protein n=1 Tax=uncultured Flavobacterium sp. TaxID=165435 RepID=UPI00091CED4F|nr:hypothetical protein [uncultured Flavobacterium sp.]OIQ16552.1 MAG: hypothetical protein BM557_09565 [Flavobacterium sp. MedPE-SWcel]